MAPSRGPEHLDARSHWDDRFSAVCAIALALGTTACVLYSPSWWYGFVGDDPSVVSQNGWTIEGVSALPRILTHSLYFGAVHRASDLYRPVAGLYFLLVRLLGGIAPAPFHVASTVLYGLDCGLLFVLFARLRRASLAIPLASVALFVAHPIHTEVVNNIKSADELLCLLFLSLAALGWLSTPTQARGLGSCQPCCVWLRRRLKGDGRTMALALCTLLYFFRDRSARESLSQAWPFIGIAAAFVSLRAAVLRQPAEALITIQNNALVAAPNLGVRLASAFGYMAKYAQMAVWPMPLSCDYTFDGFH